MPQICENVHEIHILCLWCLNKISFTHVWQGIGAFKRLYVSAMNPSRKTMCIFEAVYNMFRLYEIN